VLKKRALAQEGKQYRSLTRPGGQINRLV